MNEKAILQVIEAFIAEPFSSEVGELDLNLADFETWAEDPENYMVTSAEQPIILDYVKRNNIF